MPRAKKTAPLALKVEQWPIDRFRAYPNNPRKNDHVVDQMADTIRQFGFRIPIVAKSDGEIVDGHLRLKAARVLGLKDLPVALADDLSPEQIKAFRLVANTSAGWASWDEGLLRIEIDDLKAMSFDIGKLGFADEFLSNLYAESNAGLTDPDEAPPPPVNPVSRLGDVWILGNHRLACGDSTVAKTVTAVLAGAEPHLMVTDPPYGVEYNPNWRNERSRSSAKMGNRAIGAGAVGKVMNDDRADWRDAWALFKGAACYIWSASLHTHEVADSLIASGFALRAQIIWSKSNFTLGRGDYHWQHEPCWYAVRKDGKSHWQGSRKESTIWNIDKPQKSETGHGTQKPVECMRRPIENNSKVGEAVYEPFCGSGTTIIAGEAIGRRVLAIELSEAYVDVGVTRWMNFTGKEAVLEATGQTFAAVKAQRLKAKRAKSPGSATSRSSKSTRPKRKAGAIRSASPVATTDAGAS